LARLVPKIGPLRVLELKTPTPETEKMFEASFNASLARYKKLIARQDAGDLALANDNFDTGCDTAPGKYRLNDEAHAKLLDALAKEKFQGVMPELRAELLSFYADPEAPYATKKNPNEWKKVLEEVAQLKNEAPAIRSAAAEGAAGGSSTPPANSAN
jgi:hypothetical protein